MGLQLFLLVGVLGSELCLSTRIGLGLRLGMMGGTWPGTWGKEGLVKGCLAWFDIKVQWRVVEECYLSGGESSQIPTLSNNHLLKMLFIVVFLRSFRQKWWVLISSEHGTIERNYSQWKFPNAIVTEFIIQILKFGVSSTIEKMCSWGLSLKVIKWKIATPHRCDVTDPFLIS